MSLAASASVEKRGRRKIGKNKRDAMRDKAVQRGDRIIARIETDVLDRKALAHKPAGCVVVLDGEFRTGNAIVGGWNIEDREGLLHMRGTNEARLNLDAGGRLNRKGTRGERRAEESRKEAML